VALRATAHFLFVSCYPFWSLTAIALDMFVMWASAASGRELRDATA
jgi:uncharacterized membrane protein YwzB